MKTTMKFIIITGIMIFPMYAKPQIFSGGMEVGVSTGNAEISDLDEKFTNVIEGKNIYGYEAGIFAKFQFKPFYVKPHLLYTVRQGEVKYVSAPTAETRAGSHTVDFNLEKFEVPVLFGLNILGKKLSVEAGPVYNYIVNATEKFKENTVELKNNGYGYRAGVASEIGPLMLQLSYQGSANVIGTNKATYKEPYKIVFGLGLILGSEE